MKLILIAIAAAFSVAVYAHSGGTDKMGCHTDHKTGFYHCH